MCLKLCVTDVLSMLSEFKRDACAIVMMQGEHVVHSNFLLSSHVLVHDCLLFS